MRRRSAQSRGW